MVSSAKGGARAVARCDALGVAPFSDLPDMLFRAWLTPAFARTQEQVGHWMAEAGMLPSLDGASNLVGRYDGAEPNAKVLLIGSHLDSVRDAGRYDGPLGVMLGIELVAALHAAGERLPFAIEVIAFGDEEGSRFPASMLTSRAVAGTLDPAALEVSDKDGVSVADALAAYSPSPLQGRGLGRGGVARDIACDSPSPNPLPQGGEGFFAAARSPSRTLAYFEAHIEQGPVLEAEDLPVGIVTGIAAQLRYQVTVAGRAGHAGTTAMDLRADALAAAAEMVLAAERIAVAGPADLVATIGRLEVAPGAANVIPGDVAFTLDVRAGTQAVRDAAAAAILDDYVAIAGRRGVQVGAAEVNDLAASPCHPTLTDLLGQAVAAVGVRPYRLVSGAGHDAMVMAHLCPTAMLFIRCRGGISHNPAEHVDAADAEVALAAMLDFVRRLGDAFVD